MRLLQRSRALSLLKPAETAASSWAQRQPHQRLTTAATSHGVQSVNVDDASSLSIEDFREYYFLPEKPLLIKAGYGSDLGRSRVLPASNRWFEGSPGPSMRLSSYLDQFYMAQLPYELMHPPTAGSGQPLAGFLEWLATSRSSSSSSPALSPTAIRPSLAEMLSHHVSSSPASTDDKPRLIRLEAPLALFLAAVEYNGTVAAATDAVTQLYIAQAPLTELPSGLQQDVPAPDLVRHSGGGDVYNSSVWLGLEPTYTPWHRDPNPNLFCQLCSSKTVRLMPPKAGERIFRWVQQDLMKMQRGSGQQAVSSRIRGEEMMQGPERELLHRAVWGEEGADGEAPSHEESMREASLEAGDMLFIPKGWWHSVRSMHADGRLNGSVNWWFR